MGDVREKIDPTPRVVGGKRDHRVTSFQMPSVYCTCTYDSDNSQVSNGTDSTPLGSAPLATKTPRRSTSGNQVNDLIKKVDQLTAVRKILVECYALLASGRVRTQIRRTHNIKVCTVPVIYRKITCSVH